MAVIVYQSREVDGKIIKLGRFLPEGGHIDEHAIRRAEELNKELKSKVEVINQKLRRLADKGAAFGSGTDKWIWLGKEINHLVGGLKNLDEDDVYNNSIWPAINQYLDDGLKKEHNPDMGGGVRDHLRRCYYFVKYGFYEFLPNWAAWSELADRGDQLIHSEAFRKAMRDTFGRDHLSLTGRDYREIIKLIAAHWPSNVQERVVLEHVSPDKIEKRHE